MEQLTKIHQKEQSILKFRQEINASQQRSIDTKLNPI